MKATRCSLNTWQLLALVGPALGTTARQFLQFWPGSEWRPVLEDIVENECSDERDLLFANPSRGGYGLVACILDYMTEVRKAEMAICSVILGLLPLAMQLIGPKICDISLLGMQRPGLTILLCIGAPTATLTHEVTRMEPNEEVDRSLLRPRFIVDRSARAMVVISFLEYLVVLCAAGNALYHGYLLTFNCIVLASTLTGTFGHLPEAFAPILWILLPVPIQGLGVATLYYCSDYALRESAEPGIQTQNTGPDHGVETSSRLYSKLKRYMAQELTPCAFIEPANPPSIRHRFRPSYLLLLLNWLIKVGSWVHLLFGSIMLSSVIFLNMFDTLKVVGLLLGGTLVCRVVVAFELYGLQVADVTNRSGQNVAQESIELTEHPFSGETRHDRVLLSRDLRIRITGPSTW